MLQSIRKRFISDSSWRRTHFEPVRAGLPRRVPAKWRPSSKFDLDAATVAAGLDQAANVPVGQRAELGGDHGIGQVTAEDPEPNRIGRQGPTDFSRDELIGGLI